MVSAELPEPTVGADAVAELQDVDIRVGEGRLFAAFERKEPGAEVAK